MKLINKIIFSALLTLLFYNADAASQPPFYSYKNYRLLIHQYDSLIAINPTADYYEARGIAYFNNSTFTKAIADCKVAFSMDSSRYYSLEIIGASYYYLEKIDSGYLLMQEAFSKDSTCVYQFLLKGTEAVNVAHYQDAVDHYTKAINGDNNFFAAYVNRANCYINLKEFDKAKNDIAEAKKLDPNNLDLKIVENELHANMTYAKYTNTIIKVLAIGGIVALLLAFLLLRKRRSHEYFGDEN